MRSKILLAACLAGIGFTAACDSGPAPAAPSGPQSFLTGTWRGTVTIQVESDLPGTPPPNRCVDDLDVRGCAANEPSDVPRHDSL